MLQKAQCYSNHNKDQDGEDHGKWVRQDNMRLRRRVTKMQVKHEDNHEVSHWYVMLWDCLLPGQKWNAFFINWLTDTSFKHHTWYWGLTRHWDAQQGARCLHSNHQQWQQSKVGCWCNMCYHVISKHVTKLTHPNSDLNSKSKFCISQAPTPLT